MPSRGRRPPPEPALPLLLSLYVPATPAWCLQLKEDAEFQEFLSVHQKRMQVATWANDMLNTEPAKGKSKPASDYLNFDSDSGQESEEEAEASGPEPEGEATRAPCQGVSPPHACPPADCGWGPLCPTPVLGQRNTALRGPPVEL